MSFSPARISLGKNLGERASLKISFTDHKHILGGESYDNGTFWGKWRARYGTKLRGRNIRLIRGQVGQTLEQMDVRYYVIDRTEGPTLDGTYTIEAKDILKLADDDRAQAPALSSGELAGSLDNSTTSATLSPSGIGDAEYPASGWVCIGGQEVCSFTRSGDALTITRAQFGTVAQEHNSGDRVQIVLRYTGDDVADIIYDLMTTYAGVPASYINLSEWQAETAAYLGVIYARTITEPTSVKELVSELIEQAALAVWWDDRSQRVRLNVLREIATDTDTFDDTRILESSFKVKEQPDKRISQIWTYYGQRDPTDSGAGKDNYRSALANVDLEKETEYGSAEIRKIEAGWIETETAATRLNSIQLSRFRDPPRSFAFDIFRNDAVIPAAGYTLEWWGNQDTQGNRVPALIQVTQVTLHADRIHVEAEEMLASGVIVLVNVVFLLETGSLLQWQLPETWNDNDNSVVCIGGGGAGHRSSNNNGGKGGGGGAFSSSTNLTLSASPLPLIDYRVGAGGIPNTTDGGDTWFGGATFGAAIVAAEGGQTGSGRTNNGVGGQASNGFGDLRRSGGTGGNGSNESGRRVGGGGGGGSAGPHGDGANGGSVGGNELGGGGGAGADGGENGAFVPASSGGDGGNNRFGFGGGDASTPSGQEGGGGRGGDGGGGIGSPGGNGEQLWTQTVAPIISAGPGGGGGGGGGSFGPGGNGGNYGGGGGGSAGSGIAGGSGADGIIVITWREAE